MTRFPVLAACALAILAACSTATEPQFGPDGRPLPRVYRIDKKNEGQIAYRLLDSVNTLRSARGLVPAQLNAQLNAAAATHSLDMSVQNRPWHFGSDGSSPLLRAQRAGYGGRFLGELISETYETELETLAAWSAQEETRGILMEPSANELGFAWYQEPNGKIWWTLLTGDSTGAAGARANVIALGQNVTSEMDALADRQ